jgi:hypothetical protein
LEQHGNRQQILKTAVKPSISPCYVTSMKDVAVATLNNERIEEKSGKGEE